MKPLRKERLQQAIKQELSKILLEDMNDERLKFVTITDVELSDDQKYLKVYFSTMPGKNSEQILQSLERVKGYVSGEVARTLRLRFAPEIKFELDNSIERGVRMVKLLEDLEKKDEVKEDESHEDESTDHTEETNEEP
ncbi:MAG TPA: 30S ribosome-binding factor RbfA [Coprothermobacter proteolyticus]|uniref:Ribosome-binding factor A n=1 Tax=Coprothermobacter proteolyticus (strain ATCC 35245 / DSM 5265 / OCM 4 / BT) TaxID=309798 RepID=RBFA_COPPD|nr:30S ribosome-binding factor RbfA [Coprothermobacter proteolyticus]B5Y926.1 RecName: Full=Ribosome-binding factor A [Coprothermobacter proteolyticus DSM 5265]MBK6585938.1 30S ribosome-binding factor RbfA [Coprothermobacter sp.]ACI17327.1 ribosome-binding factor A [Coprothermobacter proteolyticus DSM 5265]MBP8983326.1 30S ribosome-binding factor RbfA [Coprothermobacter sp.]HOA64706.1 30S ribosome-binding factor RbfA [Coprothermobacter proteolyticus]HOK24075.1 30S ribosome-binding factor RbfA